MCAVAITWASDGGSKGGGGVGTCLHYSNSGQATAGGSVRREIPIGYLKIFSLEAAVANLLKIWRTRRDSNSRPLPSEGIDGLNLSERP